MDGTREPWQDDLTGIVDQIVVEQGTSLQAEADLSALLGTVEADDPAAVAFVWLQILRVVEELAGTEAAESAMAQAVSLAFAAFTQTGDPLVVHRVAKLLHRRGLRDMGVALLDHALGLGAPIRPADASKLLNLMGELLRETDRASDAETAFAEALRLVDDGSDAHDALRATILNNIGLVFSARGDRTEAKRYLIESLEIAERIGQDPLSIAITLDNLGAIESDIAKDAGPLWVADGYVNGYVDEHLRQAEQYMDRARELFEGALPESAEDYVLSLLSNAEVASQRGDKDKRHELSEHAIAIAKTGQVSMSTTWDAAKLRGEVLMERGQAQEATELMVSWFGQLVDSMEPHERISRGLASLLRAGTKIGDQALVDSVAGSLAEIDAQVLPRRLVGGSEAETRNAFAGFRSRAALMLGHCLPDEPAGIAPEWLYELVLNTKGMLAARQGSSWLHSSRIKGAGVDLLAEVRELRTQVARVDLEGSGAMWISDARRRHEEAERRLRAAEVALQRELGPLAAEIPRVTVADVQACIPADTLLLDLVTVEARDGSHRDVLFYLRAEGPIRFRDLGATDDLARRVQALTSRMALSPRIDGDQAQRAAAIRDLAPQLFEAADQVPDRILVSATGTWGLAPVCLLPDESGRPLIDDHVVTMIPSARWLATRAADAIASETSGPPVVIGDPDFDLDVPADLPFEMSVRIPRLYQAGAEARDVARSLGVDALVEGAATRQRLLETHQPRILHLACHATFLTAIASFAEQREPRGQVMRSVAGTVVTEAMDNLEWFVSPAEHPDDGAASIHRARVEWLGKIGPAAPLSRSALLLAGFNAWLAGVETTADVGTGMVSAGEFALLDLSNTELVVLSACETGVGAVDAADGSLLGLRTAALAAGASSCVSTLWNVEDEAATTLMSVFYDHLRAGDDLGQALRSAQLTLREQLADPYFWAGWVTEGANGPVSV